MDDNQKFTNCIHRSANEIVQVIKRCSCRGGNYEKNGYFCNKRQIFDINKEFCTTCEEFKSK